MQKSECIRCHCWDGFQCTRSPIITNGEEKYKCDYREHKSIHEEKSTFGTGNKQDEIAIHLMMNSTI